MTGARVLLLFASTACGGSIAEPKTPLSPSDSLPADGEIVERAGCPVPGDATAFAAEIEGYFSADIKKAGLERELAATPLNTIFSASDYERLADAAKTSRCERVVYQSGGLRVVGHIVRPTTSGPHPVVIWLRGGNRDFGKNGTQAFLSMLTIADAGFVVVATQYREADGGEGKDEFGGADVEDVLALVPLARRLPEADVSRMYLIGGSRGAMEGLLAMRRGLRVRAAALRGGMYDAVTTLDRRPDLGEGWREMIPGFDSGPERERALAERSPIRWAQEISAPLLLLHVREDWRVEVEQAERFARKLAEVGVEHELVIYERDEHQLVLHRREWIARVIEWFKTH